MDAFTVTLTKKTQQVPANLSGPGVPLEGNGWEWGDWDGAKPVEVSTAQGGGICLSSKEIEALRTAHKTMLPNLERAARVKAAMIKEPGISVKKCALLIGDGRTQVSLDMRAFRVYSKI